MNLMTVYLYVILDVYPFLTKYPFSMAVCMAPMARGHPIVHLLPSLFTLPHYLDH